MNTQPNFIVIHTDQQRADCVSINGQRRGVYTPAIDSIGYRGANFTAAYTACPVCIPQRLSLLTGQLPEHHGLFSNAGIPYLPLQTTLPAEMRKGGYQTALVGRNMHTYPESCSYGFEYYRPGDPSSDDKANDPFFRYVQEHSRAGDGGYYGCGAQNNYRLATPFHLSDDCHQTKWATNEALEFLRGRDKSRPYLLFVGYYAPHSPHNPPAPYFDRYYQRGDLGKPAIADWDVPPLDGGHIMASYTTLSEEETRCLYAGYYGNIAFIDAQIARLLQAVFLERNTYVIFTSDHGEMLGDHYRMQKNCPYQGSVHIPFLMLGPDIPASQTRAEPVGWQDIMPTILDLAGLPIPDSVDGRSMASLLRGRPCATPWREYVHGECVRSMVLDGPASPHGDGPDLAHEAGSHFLTDGCMKYIWHVTSGTEQLFDVAHDADELHDLARDPRYAGELTKWRQRLVCELAGRPEGFSDGERLIPGSRPVTVSRAMKDLMEQRRAEGFAIAYQGRPNPLDKLQDAPDLMR